MKFINILESDYLVEYFKLCHEQWSTKKEFNLVNKLKKIDNIIMAIGLISEDNLVGFISLFKKDCDKCDLIGPWYATMYVKTEYRNKGYSKLLNDELLKQANILGYDKIYLKTTLENYYENFGAVYIKNIDEKEKLYYINTKAPKVLSFEQLLNSHLKYGTTREDILKRKHFESVRENVVISPWWGVEMFDNTEATIEKITKNIFDITINENKFSFICLKNVGSPRITDIVLSLGTTKCKNLLFIGSVGSLDTDIKIGDIVIPKYSVVGDGASRYLNENLEDDFLRRQYPNEKYTNKLIRIIKKEKEVKYHLVPNYSVDTIFAQFQHVDFIKNLGCKTIEMETAVTFKAAKICNINATALFVVSDNTVSNKSLYSGRTEEENEYRHKVRYDIVPRIISELIK